MTWYGLNGVNYVEVKTSERTFRSGLIATTYRRTCPSDQVSFALSITGNVFPEPTVSYQDGLAVVEWTEYDNQPNSQGYNTKGTELINLSKTYTQSSGGESAQYTINESWVSETITNTKVISHSTALSGALSHAISDLGKVMKQRFIFGSVPSGAITQIPIAWAVQVVSVNRRNYGLLDEIDITVGNVPTIT